MKKSILLLALGFFTALNLFALEEVYILPKESKSAYKKIEKLIKKSDSIDIAVYNFEYKKIAKLLKKAAKDGASINIYFEKSKLKNKKAKYDYLCDEKNINCKIIKDKKQHIKLMIFDKRVAMFGSANLTKESFNENHELVYFTDTPKIINKLNNIFQQ